MPIALLEFDRVPVVVRDEVVVGVEVFVVEIVFVTIALAV